MEPYLENNNLQWTTDSIEQAEHGQDRGDERGFVIVSHVYANKDWYCELWEGQLQPGEQAKLHILYFQSEVHWLT